MSAFVNSNYEVIDRDNYAANFIQFPMDVMMDRLDDETVEPCFQVLPFEEKRKYSEGLHCLENRVNEDMDFGRGTLLSCCSSFDEEYQQSKYVLRLLFL